MISLIRTVHYFTTQSHKWHPSLKKHIRVISYVVLYQSFPPVEKSTVTSTVIECYGHKKKNRVYPKPVYQASVTGK